MAKTRRRAPRTYTHAEKIQLVTAIHRRYRAGGKSLKAIAEELGTTNTSYQNWLKAGIKPLPDEPKPRRLYTPEQREQLMAEVDRLRREGRSLEAACKDLGISDSSYRKWREAAAPSPAMRPVEVTALVPAMPAPLAPAETLCLVAPGGYRIEGLSVESAATLLRALQ